MASNALKKMAYGTMTLMTLCVTMTFADIVYGAFNRNKKLLIEKSADNTSSHEVYDVLDKRRLFNERYKAVRAYDCKDTLFAINENMKIIGFTSDSTLELAALEDEAPHKWYVDKARYAMNQ